MTNFTLRPVTMGLQSYRNREETTHRSADPVAAVIDPHFSHESMADEATLSAAAELLAVEIDGTADIRWDKIQSLRARIAAGTYRVPSSEIASHMIDTLLP